MKFIGNLFRGKDYNLLHVRRASKLLSLRGKKVLVVGANTGGDCKSFVDLGCAEVHGLDVIEDIGSEYQHPKVTYHRMSAEDMALPDAYFDLVYCFATMEHVPEIAPAFQEMARVTKPGGYVYSVAAPLWNSRVGHHKGDLFSDFPWIHLRLNKEEIIDYCNEHGITAPEGISPHVEYMLDPRFFNKMPASSYIEACASLPNMQIIRNDLELEPEDEHLTMALMELEKKGYTAEELRAVAHVYIARKSMQAADSPDGHDHGKGPSMIQQYINEVQGEGINLIDIGSSGSLDAKWSPIKETINLVGFDPNQEECERQNKLPSQYKSSVFLPYAVHGHDGVETLYKTKSIYCYSLLKPNKPWLDRFSFHNLFEVVGEDSIPVKAIDHIEELKDVSPDVIKIDVQGLELPILRKAGHLLDSAFYVETETGFTENYEGETTFSQLDVFMQENGFLMFDINVNHRVPRNNRLKGHTTGNEQILWAEAVWLKDYIRLDQQGKFNPQQFTEQKVKKILILCALQRCYDYGYELAEFFHGKGLLSRQDLDGLSSAKAWDVHGSNAWATSATNPMSGKALFLAKIINLLPDRLKKAIHNASGMPR